MKIESFIKRLNATELGEGVTNDSYIAIPRDVDLSQMLENQQAMTIFDRVEGALEWLDRRQWMELPIQQAQVNMASHTNIWRR